jgi:hypothetical protein
MKTLRADTLIRTPAGTPIVVSVVVPCEAVRLGPWLAALKALMPSSLACHALK